jgi:hypothetical protein
MLHNITVNETDCVGIMFVSMVTYYFDRMLAITFITYCLFIVVRVQKQLREVLQQAVSTDVVLFTVLKNCTV